MRCISTQNSCYVGISAPATVFCSVIVKWTCSIIYVCKCELAAMADLGVNI